jgi:ribosome-associated protein
MPTEDKNQILPEKSKTQKKREAEALQDLGMQLTQLSEEQLLLVPLPNNLLDAILAARKIHQHGGLKRQQQYIGKLMRDIDPQPIKQVLNQFQLQSKRVSAQFHQIEDWRDQLISNNSSTALDDVLTHFPDLDRQYLRQLIRNAQDVSHEQKSKKASRKLFQYLQELSNQTSSQGTSD